MKDAKTIVLGVTGSIAAYKAADIVSGLKKLGLNVRVILTESATRFITPLTMQSLSASPVYSAQFTRENPYEIEHISLAKLAEVFVVAPATANFLGKAANGIADDLLTSTFLATRAPIVIAPAMNSAMLAHPAVQNNIRVLAERGANFVAPERGLLACGDIGDGRLAAVPTIIQAIKDNLCADKDLLGKRIVVTAGPTREALDPVRFLSNRSSGKMGFAIAAAAAKRGADVLLIAGSVSLATPGNVVREDVVSSAQMCAAVERAFEKADALIMAAAPADFTFANVAEQKIKKHGEGLSLTLTQTEDILAKLAKQKKSQLVMGFAAETQSLEKNALDKLERKKLDFIAANDVSMPDTGFAVDTNAVTLYTSSGQKLESGLLDKAELADWLLDRLIEKWKS